MVYSLSRTDPLAHIPRAYGKHMRCTNKCKCLQTHKHTHSSSQQAVSQLLYRVSLSVSLLPPSFGKQCSSLAWKSGARHSPTGDTVQSVLWASLKQPVRANPSLDSVKPHCMLPRCGAPAAPLSSFYAQEKSGGTSGEMKVSLKHWVSGGNFTTD